MHHPWRSSFNPIHVMSLEELLCESEKREHIDLQAWIFLYHKCVYFFPVFILLLISHSFSAKTKCKFEFPDYFSCGLIMAKLNQSVHASFFIRTITSVNFTIFDPHSNQLRSKWIYLQNDFNEAILPGKNASSYVWFHKSDAVWRDMDVTFKFLKIRKIVQDKF